MFIVGNNGGDFIKITQTPNSNIIHLTVGQECTTFVDIDIPVEDLVSILVKTFIEREFNETFKYQKDNNNDNN
jgi:hypothetical protein